MKNKVTIPQEITLVMAVWALVFAIIFPRNADQQVAAHHRVELAEAGISRAMTQYHAHKVVFQDSIHNTFHAYYSGACNRGDFIVVDYEIAGRVKCTTIPHPGGALGVAVEVK